MIRLIMFLGGCAAAVAAGMAIALSYAAGGADGLWWAALAVLGLLALTLRSRWASPRSFVRPEPADATAGRGRFPAYERAIARLSSGAREMRYFDRAVRPELLELATAIYEHRHGGAAGAHDLATALGPDAWQLLDPDRPEWTDRAGDRRHRGPTVDKLAALIDRIEAL